VNSSSEILEFAGVVALVKRYVATAPGAALLETIEPTDDRVSIDAALAEAGEAMGYLRAASAPQSGQGTAIRINLAGLPDVTAATAKLRIEGTALEPREIFDLIAFLDRAEDARSSLAAVGERFPLLAARAARVGDFRGLLQTVEGRILPDGTVADSASPHLHRVRREIEKQKKAIQDSLERFLRSNRNEGVLQEEYVTIRNDRFVVPVIAGQRRRLPGVVHGASSTGQTVFLEPMETIDLNNELVRLHEEEAREVYRVLRELTDRLRVFAAPIRDAAEVIAALDLLFAKARFGIEFDCCIPRFSDRLHLERARHPLLMDVLRRSKRSVVPFTLTLDQQCRTLLISGPNTGGKTVTLKTTGLIALMAQAGLPVPCAAAELPLFEQVLADIGDDQSIERNLSTFSAHVSRLREMALDVTPASLVLLDEIGSATDPEEGGALGVALVDHFRAAGAYTLASTHLLALKVYGANTKTVVNASMGFDEHTLEPTYQLQVGLPGKSAGLDIAARLGMPEDILKRARASLTTQEVELARLVADLHRRLEEANAEQENLAKERLTLAARERQLQVDAARREAARLAELEARFETMQEDWRRRAEETIAKVAETADRRKAVDHAQRTTAKFAREMREQWDAAMTPVATPEQPKPAVAEGARVRVKGLREPARVRRILDHGQLEVEAGFMKLRIDSADVEEILPDTAAPAASKLPRNVRFQPGPELNPSVREINIIGQHAEEATDNVEKFLDAAVMATASRVRIVHGHGMGILKRAVQDLLKNNPHIAKFYPASQYEGGAGATIVELKD
jgi:DNA mismatch repair protein MutS2